MTMHSANHTSHPYFIQLLSVKVTIKILSGCLLQEIIHITLTPQFMYIT